MLNVPLGELDIAPGRVTEWRLRSTGTDGVTEAARLPSFNQARHYAIAEAQYARNAPLDYWITVMFDVQGRLDEAALEFAVLLWVRRHEVLRCAFRQVNGDLVCSTLSADEVTVNRVDVGGFTSSRALREYLDERFEKEDDTLAWPLIRVGAVVREDSATVYLAFNHLVSDGMSLPIAVNDVATAYSAISQGRDVILPEAGSYVDFGHQQRCRFAEIDGNDPRLDSWKEFIARNGELFPRFPLELGVDPEAVYPMAHEAHQLLTDREADVLESRCHSMVFAGVLAAAGICLRRAGGSAVSRCLVPRDERGRGRWVNSMGWFVNTMPIEFRADEGKDFTKIVSDVRAAFIKGVRTGHVPFVKVWELLDQQHYTTLRAWPYSTNYFSYIDYRKCPGAEDYARRKASFFVWAPRGNNTGFWFYRNFTGLHVQSVFVDTPQTRRVMTAFQRELKTTLQDAADLQ